MNEQMEHSGLYISFQQPPSPFTVTLKEIVINPFMFLSQQQQKSLISSFNPIWLFSYLPNSLIFLVNFLEKVVCTLVSCSLLPNHCSTLLLQWHYSCQGQQWLPGGSLGFFQSLSCWLLSRDQGSWPLLLFKTLPSLGPMILDSFHFFFLLCPALQLSYADSSSFDSLWNAVFLQGPILGFFPPLYTFSRALISMCMLMITRDKSAVHTSFLNFKCLDIILNWTFALKCLCGS